MKLKFWKFFITYIFLKKKALPKFLMFDFSRINELLKESTPRFTKSCFKNLIQNYSFLNISQISGLNKKEKNLLIQNIQISKAFIIDQSYKLNAMTNKTYFLLGFEETLIIHEYSSISTTKSFFQEILLYNSEMSICFLSDTKSLISNLLSIQNPEIEADEIFTTEISKFQEILKLDKQKPNMQLWKFIFPCISGYLIKKSYQTLIKYRIREFIFDQEKLLKTSEAIDGEIDEDKLIELRNVGIGASFCCTLAYHIKSGKLLVIKKQFENDEFPKLIEREKDNYAKMKYPFLPRFYGRVKNENYIAIEYINGKTLNHIKKMKLTFDEKLAIIFQLMLTIKYFHDNEMIYRDLKPNNIVIDANKTAVLIDFDRLIRIDDKSIRSKEIGTDFSDPKSVETGNFTYESDIYSLGKIIEYIMNNEEKGKNI